MTLRYRALGWIVVVLSLVYLAQVGIRHTAQVANLAWDERSLAGFLAGVGLYGLAVVSGSLGWAVLIHGLGSPLSWRSAVSIVLRSGIAKYLPGNVGHFVGRTGFARATGIPMRTVLVSLSAEAVLTLFAGALFAAVLVPRPVAQWLASDDRTISPLALWILAATAPVVVLAAVLWCRRVRPFAGRPGEPALLPGASSALRALGLFVANFAVLGLAVLGVARCSVGIEVGGYALFGGAFALAWVAGFAVPGSPGGLGVREAVLVAGLSPTVDGGSALSLAFLFRLVTLAGDALSFAVGLGLLRSAPSKEVQ